MWIIERAADSSSATPPKVGCLRYHFVVHGQAEYSVGRKGNEILLADDPSISRKHAVFRLTAAGDLQVEDTNSKYGTFVNDHQLKPNKPTPLKPGDAVAFGICGNTFLVHFEPLVVTSSCIDSSKRQHLAEVVERLGGCMVSQWQNRCTYLVMEGIQVTTKAICALVSQKPIVTVGFFDAWWAALQDKQPSPDPAKYLPPVTDDAVDEGRTSFHPNKARENLFAGKTFVFLNGKQHKKLHMCLTLGGAKTALLQELQLDDLVEPGVCVVDPGFEESSTDHLKTSEVRQHLKRHDCRMIPESDVGWSVVYCSTKEFCNPRFSFGSTLFSKKIMSQTLSQQVEDIYVQQTAEWGSSQQPSTSRGQDEGLLLRSTIQSTSKEVAETCPSPVKNGSTQSCDSLFNLNEVFVVRKSPSPKKNRLKRTREEENEELPSSCKSAKLEECPPNEPLFQACDVAVKQEPLSLDHVAETPPHETAAGNEDVQICASSSKRSLAELEEEEVPQQSPKRRAVLADHADAMGWFHCIKDLKIEDEEGMAAKVMMGVVVADLVVKRKLGQIEMPCYSSSGKNFKKFQKVHQVGRPRCIIGGSDLVPVQKCCTYTEALAELRKNNNSSEDSDEGGHNNNPEVGPFTWDPLIPKKR